MIRLWALASVAAAQVVCADPPRQSVTCEVESPQEAAIVAAKLFDRGEYQQAGACYQVAGDMAQANLAFLKAAGPRSEDTARALKAQQETAKALFNRVGKAIHGTR